MGIKVKIKPIKKASISDYIVAQIKSMIVNNKLSIGEKLPNERDLSHMFDVSRTSIRESLRTLELQGLLERSNAGTFIKAEFSEIIEESITLQLLLSGAKYSEIQHTRLMLERELVVLAASKRTEENLFNIKNYIEEMEIAIEDKDIDKYISHDILFHKEIANAASNNVLLFLYNSISELIFKIQKVVAYDESAFSTSLKYHKEIYKALLDKSADKASEELVAHLKDVDDRINKLDKIDQIVKQELLNID